MTLLSKYTVHELFSCEGSNGTIYTLTQDSEPVNLLVKISDEIAMGEKELDILVSLNDTQCFPNTIGGGCFRINDAEFHYIIMEKLGRTLQDYFTVTMSLSTVCQFGMKMLESLEKLHATG